MAFLWVPKDSSIHKGSIRQRAEVPGGSEAERPRDLSLKLSPCVKTEGKDAKSQVK